MSPWTSPAVTSDLTSDGSSFEFEQPKPAVSESPATRIAVRVNTFMMHILRGTEAPVTGKTPNLV